MAEMTPLAALRLRLAPLVAENAVFDGWTEEAVDSAAGQAEVPVAQARLALGARPLDLVSAWIESIDLAMVAAFPPERIAALSIRQRITELVWFRIEQAAATREALRSALSILALPQNVPTALRTSWNSANLMWRLAGDTATDYNHYTKRTTLSAVYGSTLLALLTDESEGYGETRAFLDRRIENVMQFEKWKSGWSANAIRRPSLSRFLGRLRYPAR
ncbi:COQ9 family protein [Sphingomonas ginkgonis]|uniref:COQ9 family protein n=1 Tax=Sphingomonas ginkgonis TaxID=2315330 RepID=A0A429V718_9SPHN|nr:COQ9 family protein [Sphingomonas ginkgonis]RST29733.1 COQ9 family protein [Sphingomonas ginkgonis]